jgi:integrase
MARDFYLYQNRNGYYYVELPIGNSRIVKSTKTKNRDTAAAVVGRWLSEGIPAHKTKTKKTLKEVMDFNAVMQYIGKSDIDTEQVLAITQALKRKGLINFNVTGLKHGRQDFIKYLYEFWNYDDSLYLRDKRAHGKSVTRRTCIEARRHISGKWESVFKGRLLEDITRNDLRSFGLELKERLAGKTVNNILHVGITALKWAYREKIIPEDITAGLGGFAGGGKKRDTFTETEIEKLKDFQYWENKKAYTAFMLSSTSALRCGECLALRRQDIGGNILHIRHNWNYIDGLKAPKNNESRTVYLLPEVRLLLTGLLTENPHKNCPGQFVFFSDINPALPVHTGLFSKQLRKAINNAGIEFDGRKIDFHSLRHYVATQWADKTGDLRQVAKVTGHKNIAMVEHYANHESEIETAKMGIQAANILNFKQGATFLSYKTP